MNRTEFVRELINKTGLNMKAFSRQAGIPYTTLRSMLERSVENASVNTVLKVCSALNISIEDVYKTSPSRYLAPEEHELLDYFRLLNHTGKEEVLKRIEEINLIPKYTQKLESLNNSKSECLSNENNTSNINSNGYETHTGMAAHNDYAKDSDELLLVKRDLDEL